MEDSLFMNSNYENSLYYDLVRARSYVLLLENIVKNNKRNISSQISFCALIDDLVLTICRMYDYNAKGRNIQIEVDRIDYIFKKVNGENNKSDEKQELENLIGSSKKDKSKEFNDLFKFRDKCIAHKDSNWTEIYDELRKSKILELIGPFLDFAEKIYDRGSNREKERKQRIESIKLKLEEEEVKNGK